ncbi:MAG: KpsF/GutQ family sugar-phosphate isomerase [Planctomycetaceae bacterium]
MTNCCSEPSTPYDRLRFVRQVISDEARALAEVARALPASAVEAAERTAACQGCVVVTGVGKAGLIGQKLVATLSSTGNRAHFMHPSEAIHGDLGCLGKSDLVWAISNSGRSDEVLRIAPHLREHSSGLIALTATEDNPLAKLADVTVAVGTHDEADPLGLAPTTTTTVLMAVGDAIALLASRLIGFVASDFARFHPGGSLGQKLAAVDRFMRPLAVCRTARADGSVRETMVTTARDGRRTGAVMLLDDDGRLAGIFTDSDLARLLETRRDALLDGPVSQVMTQSVQRIVSGTLLMKAIEILASRRISELPVVDAQGRPVGLLDITDVISLDAAAPLSAVDNNPHLLGLRRGA